MQNMKQVLKEELELEMLNHIEYMKDTRVKS